MWLSGAGWAWTGEMWASGAVCVGGGVGEASKTEPVVRSFHAEPGLALPARPARPGRLALALLPGSAPLGELAE